MMRADVQVAILAAVREIQASRRASRQVPDHALVIGDGILDRMSEMYGRDVFYEALMTMVEDGTIEAGPTIRDTYLREVITHKDLSI